MTSALLGLFPSILRGPALPQPLRRPPDCFAAVSAAARRQLPALTDELWRRELQELQTSKVLDKLPQQHRFH